MAYGENFFSLSRDGFFPKNDVFWDFQFQWDEMTAFATHQRDCTI